jgi:hypothetical protein
MSLLSYLYKGNHCYFLYFTASQGPDKRRHARVLWIAEKCGLPKRTVSHIPSLPSEWSLTFSTYRKPCNQPLSASALSQCSLEVSVQGSGLCFESGFQKFRLHLIVPSGCEEKGSNFPFKPDLKSQGDPTPPLKCQHCGGCVLHHGSWPEMLNH